MKNKVMKIYCFLLTFSIILMFSTITFAESIESIQKGMGGVARIDKGAGYAGNIGTGIRTILGIIEVIGTGATIISVTVLGIKYLAAGPNEKVDVKKQMLPFLIGSVLLFSAAKVVDNIYDLAQKI